MWQAAHDAVDLPPSSRACRVPQKWPGNIVSGQSSTFSEELCSSLPGFSLSKGVVNTKYRGGCLLGSMQREIVKAMHTKWEGCCASQYPAAYIPNVDARLVLWLRGPSDLSYLISLSNTFLLEWCLTVHLEWVAWRKSLCFSMPMYPLQGIPLACWLQLLWKGVIFLAVAATC